MSLRDALARKQRRTAVYLLPVDDPSTAQEALAAAEGELRLARFRDDAEQVRVCQEKVEQAQAAVDACYHPIRFQNLPADEFEALISAHEPTEEQRADGAHFNLDTLTPALVAACAVDSDLSEADWAAELASERWNTAERNALLDVAMSVNVTARSETVPKG